MDSAALTAAVSFAQASEIGALAVFLASDAGQSITGAALPVDGGMSVKVG